MVTLNHIHTSYQSLFSCWCYSRQFWLFGRKFTPKQCVGAKQNYKYQVCSSCLSNLAQLNSHSLRILKKNSQKEGMTTMLSCHVNCHCLSKPHNYHKCWLFKNNDKYEICFSAIELPLPLMCLPFTPSAIVNETATNDRSHDKTLVGAAEDSIQLFMLCFQLQC